MTFGPVFRRTFQPTFDRRNSVGAWWNLFGAIPLANCVAAYQPKGAADIAASYINLVTPGTFNAAPGSAPTFNTATGWTGNSTSQYLVTGITNATGYKAILIRFTGTSTTGLHSLVGMNASGLYIIPNRASQVQYGYGTELQKAGAISSGNHVIILTGQKAYRDGTDEGLSFGAFTPSATQITILSYSSTIWFSDCTIAAMAIYNVDITSYVSGLTTAANTV